ncbi:MAG: hypothetical protein H0T51_00100 [Pirellulales bacterium]|nr:hypothetical protein [Pirellulales bacterium]
MKKQCNFKLVIVDLTRRCDKLPSISQNDPDVGIWWATEQKVAALVHPADVADRGEIFLDSPLAHMREWPKVAGVFGLPAEGDCYAAPRGRVLLNVKSGAGMIYHGNGTPTETLSRIAEIYGLRKWTARVDEHYLVGAAADELFDQWEDEDEGD